MPAEIVTVVAGGQRWTAFRRAMVGAAFKDAARTFHLDIAAEPDPSAVAWTFKAGTEVQIYLGSDLVLTGYVDRYQPKLHEHSSAEISVSGRSKAQDLIDSSAVHPTGRFKNKTVQQIMAELDQAGVGVTTDQALEPVPFYQLTPGETVFRAGEKLARQQGVFLSGQPDGSIKITLAGAGRNGPLIEGQNIKSASADHNWSGRHSKVIVRGQRPFEHGPDALEIEEQEDDDDVPRYRPVVVVIDGDTDKKRAKKRAKHRRDREAGNSLKANVMVVGFHDDGGQLWTPGNLTFLQSRFLDIAQDMAIERVTYEQGREGGTMTAIDLVDPAALGSSSSTKGGKANAAWHSKAWKGK